MSDSTKLAELLLHWKHLRALGEEPTAESLCRESAELTGELRRRMRVVTQMESLLSVANRDGERGSSVVETASRLSNQAIDQPPSISGYEIIDVLGRGGMGVVYRARHSELEREVAVKLLEHAVLRTRQFERFLDEARVVAQLQHPNIVQVYDFGNADGRPYFVMELVEGGNLRQRVNDGPLDIAEALRTIETTARAVHVVHREGYIHRDLKPANILLTLDGQPKVTDFGLVKRFRDELGHTKTGEVVGTIGYMAPEQLDHTRGEVGAPTDVFALGAILYELLTGQSVVASNPAVALNQILHVEPPSPKSMRAEVPKDVEAICLKCLAKDADERYESAEALADDIQRYRQGQPIVARRVSAAYRTVKWIKRHPMMTATMTLVVIVAAIWFAVGQYHEHRAAAQREAEVIQHAKLAREILHRNCYECHGGGTQKARKKLDVLDHELLISSSRRIVVPGSPDDSRLIQRIADGSMPPEDLETTLPRLAKTELAILREWIADGAVQFPAEDPDNPTPSVVTYSSIADQAKVVFRRRCYECHRYDVAEGGIKILHHRLLLDVRKVVVPGDPETSELFQLIISEDEERMPPPSHKPLMDEEIEIIRRWIDAGAPPFPKSES